WRLPKDTPEGRERAFGSAGEAARGADGRWCRRDGRVGSAYSGHAGRRVRGTHPHRRPAAAYGPRVGTAAGAPAVAALRTVRPAARQRRGTSSVADSPYTTAAP